VSGAFPTTNLPQGLSFSAARGTGRTVSGWKRDVYLSSSQNNDLSAAARFATPLASANVSAVRGSRQSDFGSTSRTHFAVIYSADVTPLGSGAHQIFLTAVDGARLKIDGTVVIDGWEATSGVELGATVTLDASRTYNFVVEYYTLQGNSALNLTWSFGGAARTSISGSFGVRAVLPTISVNGDVFATLEGKHFDSTLSTSQRTALVVPEGFEIASADDESSQVVAASFSWGCDCLITRDGRGLAPLTGGNCGSGLLATAVKNGRTAHQPANQRSNYQILLVRKSGSTGSDAAVQIRTWRGFGYEWATIDGAPAGSTSLRSCRSQFFALPSGWELAPRSTPSSLAAIYGNWGATDIVIETTAVNSRNGDLGALFSLETRAVAGKAFYRATSVSGKCQRVLIRRRDDSAVIETQVRNVTNFVSIGDFDYATIDNSRINDPVLSCQRVPLQLPTGWTLAARATGNSFSSTIQKSGSFGTTGLVFADGSWSSSSGISGSTSLKLFLDGLTTYHVADCTNVPKKIIISRTRPRTSSGVPTGAPQAACGTCSGVGDPHITNFGRTKATYLGIGEFIYLQPNATTSTAADGSYEISARFSPVKTASSNSAIFFRWGTETVTIAIPPTPVRVPPTLARNGNVLTLTLDNVGNGRESVVGGNITVTFVSGSFVFTYPNGIVSRVKAGFWNNNLLDVFITIPNALIGKTQGLCGPCGTTFANALITSTGRRFVNATRNQVIEWGNSWSKTPTATPAPASSTTAPTTAAPTTAAPTTATPTTTRSGATTTPAPTSGDCAGDATKTEWTVNFLGATVTGSGTTTQTSFKYSVFTTETGKSLSHWVLVSAIRNVTTSPVSFLGTDGSTGYFGVKFETKDTNLKTLEFTINYPGTCAIQDGVTYIVKGGNACYQAVIRGPGLCTVESTTTPAPGTPAPPAEVDECNANLLSRARRACSTEQGVDANDVESCIFDVCVFGDTDAAKSHQQKRNEETNQVVNADKFSEPACPTPVPAENNTIVSKGKTFAVLDFTDPNSDASGTQTTPLALPRGWVVAEDSPFVRSVITCYSFGTSCILLSNGIGLTKDLQVCGTEVLQTTGDCYSPKAKVSARILITRAETNADLSLDANINLSLGGAFSNRREDQDENGNGVIVLGEKGTDETVTVTRIFTSSSSFSVSFSSKATATGVQPSNFGYSASVSVVAGGSTTLIGSVSFDANLNRWHTRSIDIPATNGLTSLVFTFTLTNAVRNTRVLFSRKIRVTSSVSTYTFGNLLANPTVIGTSGWQPFGGGFTYSNLDNSNGDGSGSLQLTANADDQDFGALQIVPVTGPVTSIYFRADSKIVSPVQGALGAGYSVYVDVIYEDGVQSTWGLNGQFSKLTTDWQSTEKVFKIPQDGRRVKEIQLVALLRRHTGTAVFDNLYLTTMDCDIGNNTGTNTDASSYGDPHLVTLDGVPYDCQRLGDFVLYTDDLMTIITRHSAAGDAAVNSITNIQYGTSSVTIERNRRTAYPFVTVNGVPTTAIPGQAVILNDGTLITNGELSPITGVVRYDIDFPRTGHKVVVTAHLGNFGVQWLQVFPKPPRGSFGKTGGLLGLYNGNPADDFTDAFGQSIPTDSDIETIIDSFAETWRVKNFVYAVNEASNVWDPTAPQPAIKRVEDYPEADRAAASKVCQGVSQFESCVLDTLMTRDTAYASSYNTMESILRADLVTARTTSAPATTTPRSSASSLVISFTLLVVAFLVAF